MISSTAQRGNTCRPPARSSAPTLPERIEQTLDYESSPPPPVTAHDPHQIWCVDVEGRLDTKTTFELWVDASSGTVNATARVWREGMECWLPLSEVAELRCALPLNEELDVLLNALPETSDIRQLPSVEPSSGIRHNERGMRAQMPTRPMGEVVKEREKRVLPAGSAAALSAAVAFGVALIVVSSGAEGAPPVLPQPASVQPVVPSDAAIPPNFSDSRDDWRTPPRPEPGQKRRR